MNQKIIIQNWKLRDMVEEKTVDAHVPGDITYDLYQAGVIADPYFGENFKQLDWIAKRDFEYSGVFTLTAEDCCADDISVVAKGIDTFADIYINDTLVCSTKNMFLKYQPRIKQIVRQGENTIRVHMHSTLQEMDKIDTAGYFGVFNVPRLFVRKAQCHFGWDWAPNMCGYGIWQELYVECCNAHRIENVNYQTDLEGNVTFFTELNYCINALQDDYGVAIEGTATQKLGDYLIYTVYDPDGKIAVQAEGSVEGKKNFRNLAVRQPKLWWPNGYGDQPLYRYQIELIRDGKKVSEATGSLAFREVELLQRPTGADTLGFAFKINGKSIYVRGSNWVPVDCFTGTITDEKYEKLVLLAKNANFNMLRVWGGGVYEKDVFYDLCDREGIMIWQDFMLACGDIPEDCPEWVDNMLEEARYQMKRLRVHPSIIYWCGGNEKTGSFALQISRGDNFVDYTLHGLVKTMDRTRPYVRQSPFSYSDVGNNSASGETHCNSFAPSLTKGIVNYRKTLNEMEASFYSECAVMGPNSLETFKKFMPEDHYWPMTQLWNDRLRDNPYDAIVMPFAKRQELYITDLYGAPESLEDFTAKGMLVHNEMIMAESDYARSKRSKTGGFITWMYSDIWPTGTWSSVDYYLEPKQAYYGLKKAYSPIRASFVQNKQGQQELVIFNDTLAGGGYLLQIGEKTLDGTVLWSATVEGQIDANSVKTHPVERDIQEFGAYLFVTGNVRGTPVHTLYSVNFWRNTQIPGEYSYETEKVSDTCVKVHITAKSFVKSLFISLPDNYKYTYSDNYLDLEAGQRATVTITADNTIDLAKITLLDYSRMGKTREAAV